MQGWEYEGGFVKNQRHGEGTFVCGAEQYAGQWVNDTYHGNGVYQHRDKAYSGVWNSTGQGHIVSHDSGQMHAVEWHGGRLLARRTSDLTTA